LLRASCRRKGCWIPTKICNSGRLLNHYRGDPHRLLNMILGGNILVLGFWVSPWGTMIGAWVLLYPREADFPQGDSQWQCTAREALARVCWWNHDNVPHSQKPCSIVGASQNRVERHQDPQGQEPVDCNDVSTLGTVRWCLHQVERGQRNHPASERKNARGGRQVPVLCPSLR